MSTYRSKEEYGFVYIWYDKKKKRYYIGSHWGTEDDGYVCSSQWMRNSYKKRPADFKRRLIARVYSNREDLLEEEQRWLSMMKDHEMATFNKTKNQKETSRYYNLTKIVQRSWHYNEETRNAVAQKVSASKKGKSTGPCSPEKAKKISEAKKAKFAERGGMSAEHKAALTGIKKKPHTEDWKAANSARMKEQWSNGSRKRAEPKQTMPREQQDKLSSEGLRTRWADPEWKARQREALKAAWARRKLNNVDPRSTKICG